MHTGKVVKTGIAKLNVLKSILQQDTVSWTPTAGQVVKLQSGFHDGGDRRHRSLSGIPHQRKTSLDPDYRPLVQVFEDDRGEPGVGARLELNWLRFLSEGLSPPQRGKN